MNAVWLRLLYIIEFLLAIPAVYTVWSQVGGQGHLDLMAWYWKLLLGGGAAWAIVRGTAAAVEHEKAWNTRTFSWVAGVIAIGALMAAATYYYHLHETPDQGDPEDSTTAVRFLRTHSRLPA